MKVLIALIIFASSCAGAIAQPPKICDVTKIEDGDTINVSCNGVANKIRFCGVDAPEIRHGRKEGQPYGEEATKLVRRLLGSGKVGLVEVKRDRYGRMVAELFVGKTFINAEVVKAGLAYDYKKYCKECPNRDRIVNAEAIAQKNKSGVWDGVLAETGRSQQYSAQRIDPFDCAFGAVQDTLIPSLSSNRL